MSQDPLVNEACAAWPDVAVDRALFATWLERRLASGEGVPSGSPPLGDMLIAFGAAHGDPKALAVLEGQFLAEVPRYVRHLDPSPTFASDVLQAVRIRLLVAEPGSDARLLGYAGQGALAAFVKICAVRVGLDLRRRKHGPEPEGDTLDFVPAGEDPELDYIRARYRGVFEAALRQAFLDCSPEERTLLRLLYLDRLPVGSIGTLYGVAISTMSRRLAALRDGLRERTRRALDAELGSSPGELSSLVRLLDSRMEMSLRQFLSDSEHIARK